MNCPLTGLKNSSNIPLKKSDPRSYEQIKSFFLDMTQAQSDPFRHLLQRLSNKVYRGREAKETLAPFVKP